MHNMCNTCLIVQYVEEELAEEKHQDQWSPIKRGWRHKFPYKTTPMPEYIRVGRILTFFANFDIRIT